VVVVVVVVAPDEDEFNQGIILPPLIIQLRKILDQYPDDTQILKVNIFMNLQTFSSLN